MKRIVVCDTGPLLHLSEAGAVHLLAEMGDVYVPPLVMAEFEANSQGWSLPQWAKEIELEKTARQKVERWIQTNQIDEGEAEAIELALQVHADWLLTDDAAARQFAESLGLEVHGSVARFYGVSQWGILTTGRLRAVYWTILPIPLYGFLNGWSAQRRRQLIICLNRIA